MSSILIIGNISSVLVRKRGMIGQQAGYNLVWYTRNVKSKYKINSVITVFRLNSRWKGKLWASFANLIEPFYIRYLIKKFQIELVHVHWANQLLIPYGIPQNIPVIVSIMGSDIMSNRFIKDKKNKFMIMSMLKRADVITSKSNAMDEAIIKLNSKFKKKIERITWGIDINHFRNGLNVDDLRSKLSISRDQIVYFDMRAAKPFYRKEVIMKAFAKIYKKINCVLLISEYHIGLHECVKYIEFLKNLSKELDIEESVRFCGKISQNMMPFYYNLSDIGISIPPSDGMPQSLFEMMACGTYPILGDLDQYKELVRDGEGATMIPVVKPDNQIEFLSKAMLTVGNKIKVNRDYLDINRSKICKIAGEKQQTNRMLEIYSQLLS